MAERDHVARLAHAVVLEVWGEEPCGIAAEAVEAVVQPKMRKRLMAALAQIDGSLPEHPNAVARKVFRVGYFVTVDVDAFDAGEAAIVGECACRWPGAWSIPHAPVAVEGEINGHRVTARILRSEAMMVKPMESGA